MSSFGFPIERLATLATRHREAMHVSELIALDPLANDTDIAPDEFLAMIRYRAVAQLVASFSGNRAGLQAFLASLTADELAVTL